MVAASGSASCAPRLSSSTTKTLRTPASFAAASATVFAPLPATRTSISPPIFCAADSALAVWSDNAALSCSAIRRIAILLFLSFSQSLKDARFVLQLVDQFGNRTDLDASLAAAGLFGLQDLEAGLDLDAEIAGSLFIERLL